MTSIIYIKQYNKHVLCSIKQKEKIMAFAMVHTQELLGQLQLKNTNKKRNPQHPVDQMVKKQETEEILIQVSDQDMSRCISFTFIFTFL